MRVPRSVGRSSSLVFLFDRTAGSMVGHGQEGDGSSPVFERRDAIR